MRMSEPRILSSSPMLLVLLSLLMASIIDTTAGQIGVCYGRNSDPRPNPSDVVTLYKRLSIQRMRLYDPDHEVLDALRGSDIELVFGVPNDRLQNIAGSQTEADNYISEYVKNYDNVKFLYITVGTEVNPSDPAGGFLFSAMQNIEKAVSGAGLATKVTTAVSFGAFTDTSPPSNGRFRDEYISLLQPVIEFLVNKQSPLFVNIYPFFTYSQDNTNNIHLDYTLFQATSGFNDGPYFYNNLFDAQLDSVYAALEKLGGAALEKSGGPALERSGGGTLKVVVSESGWPTDGRPGHNVRGTNLENAQTVRGVSIENAKTYINNLIQHVKTGTPRRPGEPIEAYIFAMFDENQKNPPGVENNFGIFYPDTQPKYDVSFN